MRKGRMSDNISYNINNKKEKEKVKVKHKIKMIIWLLLAIFMIYECYILAMYTIGKKDKENMFIYNSVNRIVNIFVRNEDTNVSIDYSLKFACLGDIYITNEMIKAAKYDGSYDFRSGYENVKKRLEDYDVALASLSTPIADKSLGYSDKTTYNAPLEIIDTLKYLNIKNVATATNHAYDKKDIGINDTIENLKNSDISQVGINDSNTRKKPIIISKNEINVGILSYATTTNIKIPDEKENAVNMLTEENLKEDINYLISNNVDFILAYLNIPNKDSLITSGEQKKYVEMLFNNKVNVILGTGSMVVQGEVEDQVEVESDSLNHVYAIYSLGDFLGKFESDDNKVSVIADIEFSKRIKKDKKGNTKDTIVDMKVNKPIFLWTNLDKNNLKTMYIIEDEIDLYNNDKSALTAKQYQKIVSANKRLKELFE